MKTYFRHLSISGDLMKMPKIRDVAIEINKPILLEFQNGKIQPGEEKSLESALFKDKSSSRKLVGVANGDMLYAGEITEDTGYNSFLIVQNDESRELKLIQVDSCTVAPLFQKATNIASTTPVKSQSLAELRKQFGSKKAKRYTEQQERLTMNIENVKEHLEKTVADITVPDLPSGLHEEGDSLYKPKINRNASTKDEVYQLTDLIPMEILDTLEEKVSEILENEDFKEFELIPTVEKYMMMLRSSSIPERIVVDKCKILLYVHYLVKFMNTPMKSMTKKSIVCDCSVEVDKYIKQNYTVNGLRPISMKDKGLCFTVVLLMLAMDHEIDLESIAKDLRIGLKKLQEFSRNLGFSQHPKNKNSIILKIPVPPPIMPNLKRKRNN